MIKLIDNININKNGLINKKRRWGILNRWDIVLDKFSKSWWKGILFVWIQKRIK